MMVRVARGMIAAMALALLATAASAQEVGEDHAQCFRQQHTLVGAISMYNLDYNQNVTEIPWQKLHEDGYFPSSWTPGDGLIDPGGGAGSHTNYQLSAEAPSGLLCTRHGYPGHPREVPRVDGGPAADVQRCHDNQRTVAGAVEMYNLDYNKSVTSIPWEELQRDGYLHHVPEDPGQGPFSYRNYGLSLEAPIGITCSVHGPAQVTYSRENLRRCLATQRLISGAVEMYNLDFNENVTSIPWKALVGGGYLVRAPRDPGGPDGTHTRYSLDANSPTGIRCSRHGSAADWAANLGGAAAPPPPLRTGGEGGESFLYGIPGDG